MYRDRQTLVTPVLVSSSSRIIISSPSSSHSSSTLDQIQESKYLRYLPFIPSKSFRIPIPVMWVERLYQEPPFYVSNVKNADVEQLKSLKSCVDEGVTLLELHPQFLKNTAYISRFIKNFRNQFRSFPLLQLMRKIKVAIEKINKNNAKDTLSNITSGFPVHLGSGIDLELPSRQYFDYCLAKILAHCQIMVRLIVCSKKCAQYFIHFLQYGHFIEISTMIIALLGHIWHQSRECLLSIDKVYNKLFTFRDLFPVQRNNDVRDYEFPSDLGKFIGDDWKDEVDVLIETGGVPPSTSALTILNQIGAKGDDQVKPILPRPTTNVVVEIPDDDMGEVICRETMEVKTSNNIPEVLGKKTLLKFLKTETELRNKGSSKRLSKKVSQFHWEKFRQLMEGKAKTNANIKDVFDKEWAKLMSS